MNRKQIVMHLKFSGRKPSIRGDASLCCHDVTSLGPEYCKVSVRLNTVPLPPGGRTRAKRR